MIQLVDVTKEYKINRQRSVIGLKNVSLDIKEKEFVSIVGPSGSGKSTLLALAGLLDRETSGEIWINKINVSSLKDVDRTNLRYHYTSFIFQFASLFPALSVLDNITLPLLLRGEEKIVVEEQANQLLLEVGLTNQQATHFPHQLSGGEQRRVAVARALLKKPLILFADEPTSALDEQTANDMIKLFHQFHENGTTILLVTHDKQLAKQGSRVIEMKNGEIVHV